MSQKFEQKKKQYEWVMGIDEAGRGPVIGPMVYGCCVWPIISHQKGQENENMENEGFNDSKVLTAEKREQLFNRMKELQDEELHFEYKILSAEYISNRMLSKQRDSLNQLSFNAAYSLIDSILNQGFNITRVYIDTVGNKQTYQSKLENDYNKQYPQIKFTVKEKADADFPVVSAASICAKVIRDMQIQSQNDENNEMGSGYPSDPSTKRWLQNNFDRVFGFGNEIRFSWSTVENIMKEKGLQVDFFEGQEKNSNNYLPQYFNPKEKKMYYQNKLQLARNFDL